MRLLGKLAGWSAGYAFVTLLERVVARVEADAYQAGVTDAAAVADELLAGLEDEDLHAHRWQPWHRVPGDTSRERRHCAVWGCTAVRDRVHV